ncbi:MAG: winged helix-turn-helix domain-containing protein [Dehalococcoidia bacterium]|nr:winged helix-turn-helix domain-containing protein [Dehalococcoidia bacterium]
MPKRDLSQADAAELVLQSAGRPMHRNDITDGIIKAGFKVWGKGGPGLTPEESVGRAITQDILRRGADSRFEYFGGKGSGMFRLRERTIGDGSPGAQYQLTRAQDSDIEREPVLRGGLGRLREPRVTETLDDLVEDVARLGLDPVPFICGATHEAIRRLELRRLEREHEEGYRRVPVQPDEFGGDEDPTMWDEL